MKKIKLYWTPFADASLKEIRAYIVKETYSEEIADRYINKLIDRVDQLKDFPNSGQEEELLKQIKQNSRYLVEGNYKIIYQYQDNTVIITDVFNARQYPAKIVKRNKHK